MHEYSPDGLMSSDSARAVPGADGAQTGQPLDETSADLALRATRYLPPQAEELTRCIPRTVRRTVHSLHGHDGFLIEHQQVGAILREFLAGPDDVAHSSDGVR